MDCRKNRMNRSIWLAVDEVAVHVHVPIRDRVVVHVHHHGLVIDTGVDHARHDEIRFVHFRFFFKNFLQNLATFCQNRIFLD